MNKTIGIVVAIIIILLIVWGVKSNQPAAPGENTPIKIGAVLPLTGGAAALGEPMKNGMELALKDKSNIIVQYEDSKGIPAEGASAYHRLIAGGVNAVVSAYSNVSVPLTKIAEQNKVPLLMSLVAADNVTNEYSYRYYATAQSYVAPAFTDPASPLKDVTDIAVIYRNDEYGNSVKARITEMAAQHNKKILIAEPYQTNETDFSTHLTKIKAAKPQALLFVDGTPAEGVAILKKIDELKLNLLVMETSAIFSDPAVQKQAPLMTFYTAAFRFSLPEDNTEFKKLYMDTYGTSPNFGAAFGYDIGTWLADCVGQGSDVQQCLSQTNSVNGLTGEITNITNHEINPPMFLVKVN